jgi:hypothetical protein
LDALTPVDSGLRVTALSTTPQADLGGVSTITVDLAEVASSVPAQVRRHLLRPVRGVAVLDSSTVSGRSVQGVIRWREGMCTHVRVVTGRCPSAAREVLVTHDPVVASALARTVTIRDGRIGGEGRRGTEYAVVTADGFLPLPLDALEDLPPGTLVRVHREGRRVTLEPEDEAGPSDPEPGPYPGVD